MLKLIIFSQNTVSWIFSILLMSSVRISISKSIGRITNRRVGSAIELSCGFDNKGNIHWSFNGNALDIYSDGRHSLHSDTFDIHSRLRMTYLKFFDTGFYLCKRDDKIGNMYHIHIPREDYNLTVPEGTKLEFNCPYLWLKKLSGMRSFTANWYLNDKIYKLPDEAAVENFTIEANKTTEGRWTCATRRRPGSALFYMQNFSLMVSPPLTFIDKHNGRDLIYMAVPMALGILFSSCILYAIASGLLLHQFIKIENNVVPVLTEEDYRYIIRQQLLGKQLERLCANHFRDQAGELENSFEYVLTKEGDNLEAMEEYTEEFTDLTLNKKMKKEEDKEKRKNKKESKKAKK